MMNMTAARDNTSQLLKQKNVPVHPYLPLLDTSVLRSPLEICQRIIALYSLAGLADGAAGDLLKNWLIEEGGWDYLSEVEQSKLESVDLSPVELSELSWKQESLFVLCWCGSIVVEIGWPSNEADLSGIFGSIPPEIPFSNFFGSFALRPAEEIVQALDLYYCLHAAVMHDELWNDRNAKDLLKTAIILERRQALEWVCSSSVCWDEVSLDT